MLGNFIKRSVPSAVFQNHHCIVPTAATLLLFIFIPQKSSHVKEHIFFSFVVFLVFTQQDVTNVEVSLKSLTTSQKQPF